MKMTNHFLRKAPVVSEFLLRLQSSSLVPGKAAFTTLVRKLRPVCSRSGWNADLAGMQTWKRDFSLFLGWPQEQSFICFSQVLAKHPGGGSGEQA
jgi:hypothetical protein